MALGSRWRKPSRRFWRWVSVVVPIGVVVFLLVGFWDWIPVSFSGQVSTPVVGCTYCNRIGGIQKSFPIGKNVNVQWVDESGGIVGFQIVQWETSFSSYVIPQCTENGSSGGCSFISVAGNYTFSAFPSVPEGSQVVNFTATYFVSLL
jgi:hypothetical protein